MGRISITNTSFQLLERVRIHPEVLQKLSDIEGDHLWLKDCDLISIQGGAKAKKKYVMITFDEIRSEVKSDEAAQKLEELCTGDGILPDGSAVGNPAKEWVVAFLKELLQVGEEENVARGSFDLMSDHGDGANYWWDAKLEKSGKLTFTWNKEELDDEDWP
jgi:hypothetical protein